VEIEMDDRTVRALKLEIDETLTAESEGPCAESPTECA
jgi:hypothetical protein